jgi:hypothetical protein
MATTTNYGWDTPDDTDLVKDGALAMRDLGGDIDTTLFGITNGKNTGLVPLTTNALSGASTVSISNVFSSAYDYYLVHMMLVPAAGNPVMSYRFRDSGGDVSASNYARQYLVCDNTTVSAGRVTTTLANNGQLSAGIYSSIKMAIYNPNLATTTSVMSECASGAGGAYIDLEYVNYTAATVMTGITFYPGSSTVTGNIRIYGVRNS